MAQRQTCQIQRVLFWFCVDEKCVREGFHEDYESSEDVRFSGSEFRCFRCFRLGLSKPHVPALQPYSHYHLMSYHSYHSHQHTPSLIASSSSHNHLSLIYLLKFPFEMKKSRLPLAELREEALMFNVLSASAPPASASMIFCVFFHQNFFNRAHEATPTFLRKGSGVREAVIRF